MTDVLDVKNLKVSIRSDSHKFDVLNGINFSIQKGETLGLVGESGCGKTMTSLSILRMIDPPGKIESGDILLEKTNLMKLSHENMRKIRGNRISMIFQEPMNSLNPVFTIGEQLGEMFRVHLNDSRSEARKKSIEMLELVNLPSPEQRMKEYPHQLSGGMRQRVIIAMALACKPDLLIADEPTTALDVTIQAQILSLLVDLQKQMGMSILFITHDLGIVSEICDRVLVMYAGKIVESGPVQRVFQSPHHPYTQGLMKSIPRLGLKTKKLATIGGSIPSLWELPKGCRFSNRCPLVQASCKEKEPELRGVEEGREVACWLVRDRDA